jgi:hypothetical protein
MVFLAQNRGMVAKAIPEKVKSQAIRSFSRRLRSTHNPSRNEENARKLKQKRIFASHVHKDIPI